jgi:hypothetical protein
MFAKTKSSTYFVKQWISVQRGKTQAETLMDHRMLEQSKKYSHFIVKMCLGQKVSFGKCLYRWLSMSKDSKWLIVKYRLKYFPPMDYYLVSIKIITVWYP